MEYLLIGVAIDVLKWANEPLYRILLAVKRLRNKRIDLIVPLQFEYHRINRQRDKARALRKGRP